LRLKTEPIKDSASEDMFPYIQKEKIEEKKTNF
jgi:hypothetical protein